MKANSKSLAKVKSNPDCAMSKGELSELGEGRVAYIKAMTCEQAKILFPAVKVMPVGITLYSVHGADGAALALTDSLRTAMEHAISDNLIIEYLH